MDEEDAKVAKGLLDTVETFADTCPDLEGAEIDFREPLESEVEGEKGPSFVAIVATVDGKDFLIVARRLA